MMISCLCSFLFTVLHTLGIENILWNKKYPNPFRKKLGSGTNCMVEN